MKASNRAATARRWQGELGKPLPVAANARETAYFARLELLFAHYGMSADSTVHGRPTGAYVPFDGDPDKVMGFGAAKWRRLALALASDSVPGLALQRRVGRPGQTWQDLHSDTIRPLALILFRRRHLSTAAAIAAWSKQSGYPFGKLALDTVRKQTAALRRRCIANAKAFGGESENLGDAFQHIETVHLASAQKRLGEARAALEQALLLPDDPPTSAAAILSGKREQPKRDALAYAEAAIRLYADDVETWNRKLADYG